MSDVEFDEHAATIASGITTLPEADRIAAACRGSGNPVALSWLAECLALHEGNTVVDIGAGLGGPAVLAEAHRVAQAIGVMEHCSLTGSDQEIGGSRFPTTEALHSWVGAAGWRIAQSAPVTIAAPDTWSHAADRLDVESPASETEVVAGIEAGVLGPYVLHAVR